MYVELKYISDLQAELLILKLISINLAPFLLKLELYWSENLLVRLILFRMIICIEVCTLLSPQTQPLALNVYHWPSLSPRANSHMTNVVPFSLKLELYWSENLLVCLILFKIIICMVVCTLLFPQTQPLLMFIIDLVSLQGPTLIWQRGTVFAKTWVILVRKPSGLSYSVQNGNLHGSVHSFISPNTTSLNIYHWPC